MPENDSPLTKKVEENSKETWDTESDYYDVKRFLELKESVKKIFENPKRHEDLKVYITKKNKLKDEMTKISTDDAYGKALGA